jgi:hypothetical protein
MHRKSPEQLSPDKRSLSTVLLETSLFMYESLWCTSFRLSHQLFRDHMPLRLIWHTVGTGPCFPASMPFRDCPVEYITSSFSTWPPFGNFCHFWLIRESICIAILHKSGCVDVEEFGKFTYKDVFFGT